MPSLLQNLSLPLLFTFLLFAAAADPPVESSPSPSPQLPQDELSPPPATPSPSPALALSPPAPPPSDLAPNSPSPAPSPADDAADVPTPAPTEASDGNYADQANVEAKDENSGGMSGGKKAGIAIGVIGAACVAGVGVVVYKKRKQNIERAQYGNAARREFL